VTALLPTRAGAGSLPLVPLRAADGASAEVYLHGAHVVSWRPAPRGDERLFLSARSEFRNGAAIRGGIPVIFPQFAAEGPLPRHGFARTTTWSLDDARGADDGSAVAILSLRDTPDTRAIWDARFRATISVRVGGAELTVGLAVENDGTSPLSFSGALHTYLRVLDVARAEVVGLEGAHYRDAAERTTLRTDDASVLRVTGELDRVYVGAPSTLLVREPGRALRVATHGFPDVVLWNPGRKRAAGLADMEPDGERAMLCVEAAVVQTPVTLAPGARWEGSQTLDAAVRA
jgi:glucose-6-phosphate 1-epimerase